MSWCIVETDYDGCGEHHSTVTEVQGPFDTEEAAAKARSALQWPQDWQVIEMTMPEDLR